MGRIAAATVIVCLISIVVVSSGPARQSGQSTSSTVSGRASRHLVHHTTGRAVDTRSGHLAKSSTDRRNLASLAAAASAENSPYMACSRCHANLDQSIQQGKVPGLVFSHASHFSKGVADCAVCHPLDTHQGNTTLEPTMTRCEECHGTTSAAIAPGKCTLCHTPEVAKAPPSHLADNWVTPTDANQLPAHARSAMAGTIECSTCHQQSFCASCHGVTAMPHPEGWAGKKHAEVFFSAGASVCERCHVQGNAARSFCDTCHHPEGPKDQSWIRVHP